MAGDHTETLTPAVLVIKGEDVEFGIGYHEQLQISLTTPFSLADWLGFRVGASYLAHRNDVATQLNARVGFDSGPFKITHDSNGGLNPETNTGINCGYVKL